jgi:hypothetical protein
MSHTAVTLGKGAVRSSWDSIPPAREQSPWSGREGTTRSAAVPFSSSWTTDVGVAASSSLMDDRRPTQGSRSSRLLEGLRPLDAAKGTTTRMRMTAHQDANFSWHIGDLNDIMALGCAAAYCDLAVAENKWGDVLQRHRKHLHATVTTDVANLPGLLIS